MRFQLYIQNRTPLSFRSSRAAADADSLDYIPGSSLLGSLAEAHILLKNDPAEFNRFFFQGNFCAGDMYPANFKKLGKSFEEEPFLTHAFPATAVSCKRFGGFREETDIYNQEGHGVFDLLKQWTVFALSGNTNTAVLSPALKCPAKDGQAQCGNAMIPLSGYYGLDRQKSAEKISALTRMVTRTGIDRRTGTARQGIIYSREILSEGQFFTGEIRVNPACQDEFFTFLEEASTSGFLRVGNNRSRGAGEIVLSHAPYPKEADTAVTICERVLDFTGRVRELSKACGVSQPFKYLIPITLQSNTLILDRLQRCCSGLDDEIWKQEISSFPATLVYASTSCRKVIGWNSLYNFPREASMAINKGSVFVFGLEKEPEQSFWEQLAESQEVGIGERKNEGLGRIAIADKFHLEVYGI